MIRIFTLDKGQKPTAEQLQEVLEAKKRPIIFDEDSPEMSPAMYKAFKSAVVQRNRKKNAKKISDLKAEFCLRECAFGADAHGLCDH